MSWHLVRVGCRVGLVIGAAAWITLGCLDAFATADRTLVRVALLPSLAWLIGAISTAIVTALVLLRWIARMTGDEARAADVLRPLGALAILILPYLPWLPDLLPVVTVLAGPGRWLVWAIVLSQCVRNGVPLVAGRSFESRLSHRRYAAVLLTAGVLASGTAAYRLTRGPISPGGDEPHYLVIAQSLWLDGDLKIENNHTRGDYHEFFGDAELKPDYLARGTDGEIYSVHPVGLPVLLSPVYGWTGYPGVVSALIAMSAAGGVIAWIWTVRLGLPMASGAFAWVAIYLGVPFLLHSFKVYPEAAGAATLVLAMTLLESTEAAAPRAPTVSLAPWVGVGIAAGALPWLATKYAPMAAALVVIALGRIWIPYRRGREGRWLRTAAVLGPTVVAVAAWLGFFELYWGRPWPTAAYGNNTQTTSTQVLTGGPGLLFDQEFGALFSTPVLLLAATGLLAMWRDGGRSRRRSVEIAALVAALLGTVGSFHMWWGGGSSPGRQVTAAMLILAVPIAWQHARTRHRPLAAAMQHVILTMSVGVTGLLVFAQEGFLTVNARDGSAAVLTYISSLWGAAAVFPSFIAQTRLVALAGSLAWLAVIALATLVLHRLESQGRGRLAPGRASLIALIATGGVVVTASLLAPAVMATSDRTVRDLQARGRSRLLDEFDAERLPLGITYDPLRFTSPTVIATLMTLSAMPGDSQTTSDTRALLYGHRFQLPAGRYQFSVEVPDHSTLPAGTPFALQVGRRPPPLVTWSSEDLRDGRMEVVDLAVDARYVGILDTPGLADAHVTIRVRPLVVTDRAERRPTPPVLGAARFGETSVFFFDEENFLEHDGFWVRGAASTHVIAARPFDAPHASTLDVDAHCGGVPNLIEMHAGAWDESVTLAPFEHHVFRVPASGRHAEFHVRARHAWVPATIDPSSPDQRSLGCWIQFGDWSR